MVTRVPRLAVILSLITILLIALALPASAGLTGAVWTTTANGAKVNANLYDQKCPPSNPCVTPPLVPFLSGGPNFASPTRWVPDGDYVFQVTDPAGKTLLSTDDFSQRVFTVATHPNGTKYVIYGGNHITCTDLINNLVTIALCPFDDTPNNGGVYKLWITGLDDYLDNVANPQARFGFVPSLSKTDNFKVKKQASVYGSKVDDQGNPLPGLHIILYSVVKVKGVETLVRIADTVTDGNGEFSFTNLVTGKYAVREDLPGTDAPSAGLVVSDYSGWTQVAPSAPGIIYFNITKGNLGGKTGPGAPICIGQFVNTHGGQPVVVTLSGKKFLDTNGDGTPQGKPGIPNWTITLEQKTGNGSWEPVPGYDDAHTDQFGNYAFIDLPAGRVYQICEVKEDGWLQTAPTVGHPGPYVVDPSWANVTVDVDDQQFVVAVGADAPLATTVRSLVFGNKLGELCVQKLQSDTGGPAAGFEFTLYYADGVTPVTEDGVLSPVNHVIGSPITPITTDSDGTACWENLLGGVLGDYVVKESPQIGWRPEPLGSDTQPVNVPLGGSATVTFSNHAICLGLTPGYWRNWRNHYTADQFASLLPGTIAGTIAEADAIFNHWDANPDDYLSILKAFTLADQLTLNLTQHPDLPNPSGGSLVPQCVLTVNGVTISLGDALAASLAILADPASYSRDYALVVKDWLAAFATSSAP